MAKVTPVEMTIDDLARRSGLTTRNIRAYQARGLLPAPRLQGRVGIYDERHLARLRLITRLQHQGFSLASLAELLRAWEQGRSLGDVLGLEEELTAPWADEEPEVISLDDLVDLFPGAGPDDLEAAVAAGLLEPGDAGEFLVPHPSFLRIGAGLVSIGIPLRASLAIMGEARLHVDHVASEFMNLFEEHVWRPFIIQGMPPEELSRMREAIHELRPLAFDALMSMFAVAMDQETANGAGIRMVPTVGDLTSRPQPGEED